MDTQLDVDARPRVPLSRERVLRAAVALADEHGVEAIRRMLIASTPCSSARATAAWRTRSLLKGTRGCASTSSCVPIPTS